MHLCLSSNDELSYRRSCEMIEQLIAGVYADYTEWLGRIFTLETSGEDVKTTLVSSVKDANKRVEKMQNTLQTSREDAKHTPNE